MKKEIAFICLVSVLFVFWGCVQTVSLAKVEDADSAVILSGSSTYVMSSNDNVVIYELEKIFNEIKLERTSDTIDEDSMLSVYLYKKSDSVGALSIDKNGICKIGNENACYIIVGDNDVYNKILQYYNQGR